MKTPLTPERWQQIRLLFDKALALPEHERVSYVHAATVDDSVLGEEVISLLEALSRDGATWQRPDVREVREAFADAAALQRTDAMVGTRLGVYEMVRLVGSGGMGAVYEGVRADDQFRKRVAIKLLRRGYEGDLAIRRLRYERQILANLSHQNIAALLDGGVTEDAQPYLVMEFVEGVPITTYARTHLLDVRARVQLLRQVCAAVQHAHQNLVVHRDLKPGNILVADDGTVKLLDFGIARLLREAEGADELPPTRGGAQAFTPDYASPEQLLGMPAATPSDVYALGVIACELLTGYRPFSLDGLSLHDMQDLASKNPAPLPSSLVTQHSAAQIGDSSVARLTRQLSGDLDAIILQALRREPERRYGSAEQLATDLQRYLDGLPVSARRDSLRYRMGRFVRRRRVEVGAAALVLLAMTGGLVATTRQMRRAEVERAKTEQANEFLATMLSAVDPGNEGRDVTVAQVLSQAAADIDQQELDPEVEAQIRHTLGQTYFELGLPDSAAEHIERAVALRRQVLGEIHPRTAMSYSYLAAVAEARGELVAAESIGLRVLDIQRRLEPTEPALLASALDNMSRLVEAQGRLDESMEYQLQALAVRRAATDTASRSSLPYTLNNLSVTLQYSGEIARAESLAVEALEAEASVRGRESMLYGTLLRNMASIHRVLGRKVAADTMIERSLNILREVAGLTHPEYLSTVSALATMRSAEQDWPVTEAAAREVVDAIGGAMHESHPQAAVALQHLGLALAGQGKTAAADSALERSLALRRAYLPPDHWAIASSESVLGHHYGRTARQAAGERLLRGAYDVLAATRGADADVTRLTATRLAEVLELRGRQAEADEWRLKGGSQ